MRDFSFFVRRKGGPGEIRGIQMADYLKGKFNPESDYENDVCIYVLGAGPKDWVEPEHTYHDIMDCDNNRFNRIKRWAKKDIISVSLTHADIMREHFGSRNIFIIPQHHCNFKREKIPKRPVKRVGCIGGDSAIQWPHYAVERWLKRPELDLEWHFESRYWRRRYVVEFYKGIDIQISFRPTHARGLSLWMNPLKLSNAGSFGIPTVAYPEPAYVAEWKNECLWGETMTEIMTQVKRLKDNPSLYEEMAGRALAKSEQYHIDKVASLYRSLPGTTA